MLEQDVQDLVSAVSVGKVGDKIVVDLDKEEEDFEGGATDIPIAMTPRTGKITLLQLDGEISKEELDKALKASRDACNKIYGLQKKALKEKYGDKNV